MLDQLRNFLSPYFERAIAYPNVDPNEDFNDSYLISVGKDEAEKSDPKAIVDDTSFSYTPSQSNSVRLAEAEKDVNLYDVTFETKEKDGKKKSVTLHDRVLLIGYGENASPDILKGKFKNSATDTECPENNQIVVMQGQLANHTVVAAASYSEIGPVTSTVHRSEGDKASVTVSFYTKEQADRMTGTEQSYAGVKLSTEVILNGGTAIENPLAYVAVWGALKDKNGQLMANPAIPQQTTLPRASTVGVMLRAIEITNPELLELGSIDLNTLDLDNLDESQTQAIQDILEEYMSGHMMGAQGLGPLTQTSMETTRYERAHQLAKHVVPTNVIGEEVFAASIYEISPEANAPKPNF